MSHALAEPDDAVSLLLDVARRVLKYDTCPVLAHSCHVFVACQEDTLAVTLGLKKTDVEAQLMASSLAAMTPQQLAFILCYAVPQLGPLCILGLGGEAVAITRSQLNKLSAGKSKLAMSEMHDLYEKEYKARLLHLIELGRALVRRRRHTNTEETHEQQQPTTHTNTELSVIAYGCSAKELLMTGVQCTCLILVRKPCTSIVDHVLGFKLLTATCACKNHPSASAQMSPVYSQVGSNAGRYCVVEWSCLSLGVFSNRRHKRQRTILMWRCLLHLLAQLVLCLVSWSWFPLCV
jgi:hypothetical protein